jgi:hypothetical protein
MSTSSSTKRGKASVSAWYVQGQRLNDVPKGDPPSQNGLAFCRAIVSLSCSPVRFLQSRPKTRYRDRGLGRRQDARRSLKTPELPTTYTTTSGHSQTFHLVPVLIRTEAVNPSSICSSIFAQPRLALSGATPVPYVPILQFVQQEFPALGEDVHAASQMV